MMQERYGEGKEQAEPEAAEFLRVGTQANGGVSPPEAEPARVPAPSPPAHREESPPAAAASSVPLAPLAPHQDGHPPATRPETESPPAAGYAHSATVWISPRVLRWVAPLAVLALFVFLFLPWTGAYPGGYGVYTQNGFQTTWGGVSVDPVGAKALDSVQPYANVGANRLMLLYTLLVLLALVIILAPLALTPARAQVLPPVVRSLWRRRLELLSAVGLVALLVLLRATGQNSCRQLTQAYVQLGPLGGPSDETDRLRGRRPRRRLDPVRADSAPGRLEGHRP